MPHSAGHWVESVGSSVSVAHDPTLAIQRKGLDFLVRVEWLPVTPPILTLLTDRQSIMIRKRIGVSRVMLA